MKIPNETIVARLGTGYGLSFLVRMSLVYVVYNKLESNMTTYLCALLHTLFVQSQSVYDQATFRPNILKVARRSFTRYHRPHCSLGLLSSGLLLLKKPFYCVRKTTIPSTRRSREGQRDDVTTDSFVVVVMFLFSTRSSSIYPPARCRLVIFLVNTKIGSSSIDSRLVSVVPATRTSISVKLR